MSGKEPDIMNHERILIVEDDAILATHLALLLEKTGYQVLPPVASGEDAVWSARERNPDLIIMDIQLLGQVNGIEAANRIREKQDIPVIFLTAYSDDQKIREAGALGPYGYLVKPVQERDLLSTLDIVLYKYKIDKKLRESEERYRSVFTQASDAIAQFDAGSRKFQEGNPAFQKIFGVSDEDLKKLTLDCLLCKISPPDSHEIEKIISQKEWFLGERSLLCKDRSVRFIEVSSSLISVQNTPVCICLIAHDVTDRKRGESALKLAIKKLNLLGSITRHDILNKLMILEGHLSLIRGLPVPPSALPYLEKAIESAGQIRTQIAFTKTYEDLGVKEPVWHDIRCLLQITAGSDPPVVMDGSDYEIFADPLFEKVFYNLFDNTLRHGRRSTRVRVSTVITDNILVLTWEDDGVGVPREQKEKIFARGYGKNTGMGLFLAREILGITGMTIRETGEEGKGARFEILVPSGTWRSLDPRIIHN